MLPVAPRGSRDSRGQASLEYLAAVALVALLLAGAAAVPVPGVGERVAHAVRLGICLVAADVCRNRDARAAGLAPCTVSEAVRGSSAVLTIALLRFGERNEWTAALRSDGTVTVTRTEGGSVGVSAGIGAEFSPAGASARADASLDIVMMRATGWTFPSATAARTFIAGLPGSAKDEGRWRPAWRSYRGGEEASAAVRVAAAEFRVADAAVTAGLGAGARIDRDGAVTALLDAGHDGLAAFATGLGQRTPRSGQVYAEYTWDAAGPRALVFRSAGAKGERLVEWSATLDLRDPVTRAAVAPLLAAKAPWPPAAVRQVRAALVQARRTGVLERTESVIEDRSSRFSAAARFGLTIGLDAESTHVDKRLLSASAWTHGSRERERFDCEPGAA